MFAEFIICGSPMDVLEAKKGIKEADNSDILFFLIDLYKSVLFINLISFSISNLFTFYTVEKWLFALPHTSLWHIVNSNHSQPALLAPQRVPLQLPGFTWKDYGVLQVI